MSIKQNLFIASLTLLVLVAACNSEPKTNSNEATPKQAQDTAQPKTKTILFFGNSLTAGYGLDDMSEAFPALIQNYIDSLGLPYKTINAGLSGETSAGGKSRIDWLLKQPIDVFVLELGANDGLRGIAPKETIKNLQAIIDKVKTKYPQAKLVLLGMQVPPNLGKAYTTEFKNIYPQLAAKNNMALVPFLLEGVGGVASLNQADGIHPTAEGDRIVAKNVWATLKDVLAQ